MTPPKIQALGIVQDGWTMRWRATGYAAGIGWLEAWGPSLISALEVCRGMFGRRVYAVSDINTFIPRTRLCRVQ
jgi:hypothetical protein